jgi:hypothetical protein
MVTKTNRAKEVRRTFLVQVLVDNKTWCDLFKIAASNHLPCEGMRLKSGLGLFAARAFKAAELVGYYIGSVRKSETYTGKMRTEYALLAKSKGVDVIVDPGR